MKVISANIGKSHTIIWNGKEEKTGIFKKPVEGPVFLGKNGVKGDHVIDTRVHGGSNKACYLYSASHYKYWKKRYPDLDWNWGMFGENLTIDKLDEREIFTGDVFEIGEAVIQIFQPRSPCYKLGIRFNDQEMIQKFIAAGFPGAYVRVLKEGNVQVGDEMILAERFSRSSSIAEVFHLLYKPKANKEQIKMVIDTIAESCQKSYEQKVMES